MNELPFSVSKDLLPGCELIRVEGELDMLTAPELAVAIDSCNGSGREVVVDLSGVSFIDSHGLHVVMGARPGGQHVILVCPDGDVSRLLQLVQATRVLTIYKRLDDYLDSLDNTRTSRAATS
jgi:anti-sigma B factor antagonist